MHFLFHYTFLLPCELPLHPSTFTQDGSFLMNTGQFQSARVHLDVETSYEKESRVPASAMGAGFGGVGTFLRTKGSLNQKQCPIPKEGQGGASDSVSKTPQSTFFRLLSYMVKRQG